MCLSLRVIQHAHFLSLTQSGPLMLVDEVCKILKILRSLIVIYPVCVILSCIRG